VEIAKKHGVHFSCYLLKWAVQTGANPIPFSVKPEKFYANLRSVTEDPLTAGEMEQIQGVDKNCRFIKGHVFLWPGAKDWHDLWDEDGVIKSA
jgi:diketogulonate reductase-like aldo/keto reductase